jgi:formylglycine-generating enzyme required for sulfatase activity
MSEHHPNIAVLDPGHSTATLAALNACSAEIVAPTVDNAGYESLGTCFLVDVSEPDAPSRRFALTAHHCVVEHQSLDRVSSLLLRFPHRDVGVNRIAASADFLRESDLALLELAADPEVPSLPCVALPDVDLSQLRFLVRGCASGMRTQFSNFTGAVIGVERLREPLSNVSLMELAAESFAHNLLKGISGAPICALTTDQSQSRIVVVGVVREVASREVATSRFYGSTIAQAKRLTLRTCLNFRSVSPTLLLSLQTSSFVGATRGGISTRPTSSDDRAVRLYLESVISRWNYKTSPLLPADVAFPAVAVDLEVRTRDFTRPMLAEYSRDTYPLTLNRRLQLEALLADELSPRRLFVLGDPGGGKTTLLQMVAARFASRVAETTGAPFPIFISLAEFSSAMANAPTWSLNDAYQAQLASLGAPGSPNGLSQYLDDGSVILLLDGYDEVVEHKREPVLERLLAPLSSHKRNCAVVSSRKVGFRSVRGFEILEIAPLTLEQQRQLLVEICGAEQCAAVLRFLAGNSDLRDLAAVPLTLTILAVVAREYTNDLDPLMESRCELLRTALQLLLEGRHRSARGTRDPIAAEDILAKLSFALHHDQTTHEVYPFRQIQAELDPLLRPGIAQCPWSGSKDFLLDVSSNSGVIAPIDSFQRQYRYLHRWFREYLAALAMSKSEPATINPFIAEKVYDNNWSEVLVLYAGMSRNPNEFLSALMKGSRGTALRALAEVSQIDVEVALKIIQLPPTDLRERRNVFKQLGNMLSNAEMIRLLKLYVDSAGRNVPRCDLYFVREILAQLALPSAENLSSSLFQHIDKPATGLFREARTAAAGVLPYWCPVSGGAFEFGAALDDPLRPTWVPEQRSVDTAAFEIGVVPVTFNLYWQFDPTVMPPENLVENVPPDQIGLHPVVNVSWYEANVFCRWLNQCYPGIRLPNEYEWERAASWDEQTSVKRRFPWGNDWDDRLLNSWHSGPNQSTAVGSYPKGAAPCGALDMAGNVWEWCANWFFAEEELEQILKAGGSVPEVVDDGQFRKVDRGGGWYHDVGAPATFLRAADDPADRFWHCGFRLARSK